MLADGYRPRSANAAAQAPRYGSPVTDHGAAGTIAARQRDRASGVLAAMACADALGAPHEFGPPLPDDVVLAMTGGGTFGWAPGEWTDDTQMAVVLLRAAEAAAADGGTLVDRLDDVARGWADWARTANDVGAQTGAVLEAAARAGEVTGTGLTRAADEHHAATGRSGGNGSLMRTAPVALAYLHDELAMADAARAVSRLTHHDPDAGDACVLWCAAIRRAVLTGDPDMRRGLALLPVERHDLWSARLDEAEQRRPADFTRNGWVVEALQAAWCAIQTTPVPAENPAAHLRLAVESAVRGGRDADTVAAIAGALLGARWGLLAVPDEWLAVGHGWPGLTVAELAERGRALAESGLAAVGDRRDRQRRFASSFNGYLQICGPDAGPVELGKVLDPMLTEYGRTGVVPEWAALDLLRGWAFFMVRADRHGGGYGLVPGGTTETTFERVLHAIADHPDAQQTLPRPPLA